MEPDVTPEEPTPGQTALEDGTPWPWGFPNLAGVTIGAHDTYGPNIATRIAAERDRLAAENASRRQAEVELAEARGSAERWALRAAQACNERDEAQEERDAAREELAALGETLRRLASVAARFESKAGVGAGKPLRDELLAEILVARAALAGDGA